jgi:PAS domain S-box-containing protein
VKVPSTDHEATKEALERVRRTLLVLTRCNEAILRATSEEALFADVCREIVEAGGYRMCWIGVAENDERRTVRPVAYAGHEDGFLRDLDVVWADVPLGRGPIGTSIREGRVVVGRDFAADATLAPWRSEALRRGYVSSTALPIAYDGQKVGVLTMYTGNADVFSEEEIRFLRQLAGDLGYGAVSLRRRVEKERLERKLRESEASLRAAFDLNPDATNVNRLSDGRYIDVNESFLQMTGWTRQEVLGRTSIDLGIWGDVADRDRMVARLEKEGFVRNLEARFRTRTGQLVDGLMSARLMSYGGEPVILSITRDVTEWKRNERRYRLLADNSLDVIWTLDLQDLRFSYVSPAIQRLRGLTVEQAMAEPLEQSLTPESLARVTANLSRPPRPAEAGAFTGVFDQPCADGSIKHVEITTSYVRNDAGRPVAILGVSRDATARVEAERALEQSERRLATIVSVAQVGFLVTRADDRRIVDANEAWCSQFGWKRDEVLGRTTAELEVWLDPSQWDRMYERLPAGGTKIAEEVRVRRRSGDEGDFLITGDRAEIGGEACIIAAWQDVTALRRADVALRTSEARFRTLIEQSTDMIVLLDRDGRSTFWSPTATEVLGWEPGEMQGKALLDLAHPDDLDGAALALERLLAADGSTGRLALRIQHRTGGWRSIDGTCRNLLSDPAVRALVLNTRDVTAQIRLEAQYRQAQKLESIGRLAGGVAHDFNNLLTVILSSSEVMKQDRAAGLPVDDDDIEQIHAAGERARDLTRQLLAFARKQVIAPVSLDLNAVVRGSEKLLHRVLGEDVHLMVKAETGLWATLCDAGQIEQVLVNLAVNARDAMPGGGALTIETRNVEAEDAEAVSDPDRRPGRWVRLTVRDTGLGMSPEAKAHLFEPFFTTKEHGKGTGLGLATVHGIVAQSGGHLHVESEPGRGTTFHICLPPSDAPQVVNQPAPPAESTSGSEAILLVEDDPLVRGVTLRALKGSGYRVIPAASGEEALAIAGREGLRIDLVVTDVVMPGMTGREVVDELRRRLPRVPALFVSGYTQDAIVQRGVLDSGVAFLPKPFTPSTLVARVRALLDSR